MTLEHPPLPSLRKIEWEVVAGLLAAVAAMVLHFLHFTDAITLRVITLVLVALLFLRDFRKEGRWEMLGEATQTSVRLLEEIKAATLVSFWGEPFMAAHHERRIPGYIIHVRPHSELIGRLRQVERGYR